VWDGVGVGWCGMVWDGVGVGLGGGDPSILRCCSAGTGRVPDACVVLIASAAGNGNVAHHMLVKDLSRGSHR